MGDGTKENPYTREDVLRLIEEHGGKAEGLDLSGKYFEKYIDLSKLVLLGIILRGSDLMYAHLEDSTLCLAHLEDTNLFGVHFEGADLRGAHLEGADLMYAYLEGTDLAGIKFPPDTKLDGVDWGNYKIGEELSEDPHVAESIYRRLKQWYTEHGMYDIAAKFHYREREAGRKGASHLNDRAAGWLSWAVFGHGEGWKRILLWIAGFVLLFALIYFAIGTLTPNTFWNSLYYSAVSFIALGYGSWVKEATGWVKGLGVFETFLGFFMMTLLLVTFVRKWAR